MDAKTMELEFKSGIESLRKYVEDNLISTNWQTILEKDIMALLNFKSPNTHKRFDSKTLLGHVSVIVITLLRPNLIRVLEKERPSIILPMTISLHPSVEEAAWLDVVEAMFGMILLGFVIDSVENKRAYAKIAYTFVFNSYIYPDTIQCSDSIQEVLELAEYYERTNSTY